MANAARYSSVCLCSTAYIGIARSRGGDSHVSVRCCLCFWRISRLSNRVANVSLSSSVAYCVYRDHWGHGASPEMGPSVAVILQYIGISKISWRRPRAKFAPTPALPWVVRCFEQDAWVCFEQDAWGLLRTRCLVQLSKRVYAQPPRTHSELEQKRELYINSLIYYNISSERK